MDSYLSEKELKEMPFKKIGKEVKISRRAVFYFVENIEIGNHVRIDDFAFLSGGGGIRIGDYVHVSVGAHLCGTVTIGEETWVGAGVIVSNNIDICEGCMVGTGAVVVKTISEAGVYTGVPAKRSKK